MAPSTKGEAVKRALTTAWVVLLLLLAAIWLTLLVVGVASSVASDRSAAAKADALTYAQTHDGFDTYSVRCGPRYCRWYLDDLDVGRTCTARTVGPVRCSRWRVPTPDPYPG